MLLLCVSWVRTGNILARDGQNFDSGARLRKRIAGVVRLWSPYASRVEGHGTRSNLEMVGQLSKQSE